MKQTHLPGTPRGRAAATTAPLPASAGGGEAEPLADVAIDGLLAALTLEEKVSLLSGGEVWAVPPVDRLDVPGIVMSDGPSGVRGASFITSRSACFPCGTALAATWDPQLVHDVGAAIGREARHAGVDVLLAPTVNLHRHPRGGRNFESFSEDPELTARMAVAYVEGVQSNRVACCVKHLVANESEFERHTISSELDEDVLRELYLLPFEEAAGAGAWSVMASYNRLNGTHASENPWLLTEVLREEWAYDGVIVSDWFATHSVGDALVAGLDVEMPGPARYRGARLIEAVRAGDVATEAVDRAVRRMLRLIGRTSGARPVSPDPAAATPPAAVREVIRRAGARAMVLLKNEDQALPLPSDMLARVALIGPGADVGESQGGGSAQVNPERLTGILPALADALAPAEVVFERGCVLPEWPRTVGHPLLRSDGVELEFLHRATPGDPPLAVQIAPTLRGTWVGQVMPGMPNDQVLVRAHAVVRSADSGVHTLSLAGTGAIRIFVDGRLVLRHELPASGDTGFDLRGHARRAPLPLTAGVDTEVVVEFEPDSGKGLIAFDVGIVAPEAPDLLDRAAAAAGQADAAVVVVGSPPGWETEGRDRPSMELPGRQDELVARVAAANPRTVVVLNAGGPSPMPWAGDVAAIVQMWFPGQELGASLADVLTGAVNPSGRLPTSFPHRDGDLPSAAFYPGSGGVVRYGERLGLGYRRLPGDASPAPLFPFGHGLSYSRFVLGDPEVSVRTGPDGATYLVSVPVTHNGGPPGREVVQLYVSSVRPDRPMLELKGFAAVELGPEETKTAVVAVPQRRLRAWTATGWAPLSGPLTAHLGTSCADLPRQVPLPDIAHDPTTRE